MVNQKAKKTKGVRNDARKNGKAPKKAPGRTRSTPEVSELELVLLGKGMYTRWAKKAAHDKPRGIPKRVKDSED